MTRTILSLVMLFALISTEAQTESKTKIRVELKLGNDYALALGQSESGKAKQLTEKGLVKTLNDHIKYFDFVASGQAASHTLTFRIDKPRESDARGGTFADLSDYYLFLDFNKNDTDLEGQLHWLFRDSASSLSGADSSETIAGKIICDISQKQYTGCDETNYQAQEKYKTIAANLLSKVSFTSDARFKPEGNTGWIIEKPRQNLCMGQDSRLKIQSLVPPELFENDFDVVVKRRISGDDKSTFTLPDDNVDVGPLLNDPARAEVLAIFVTAYIPECQSPITENLPVATTFDQGGNP